MDGVSHEQSTVLLNGDQPDVSFTMLGGVLCLDFANTADWHASEQPIEQLTGYDRLVSWASAAGAVDRQTASALAASAAQHPDAAMAVYQRAIALREAAYRLFSGIAHGRGADDRDLAIVNTELSRALARALLWRRDNGFRWGWSTGRDELDLPLWPVARSAADLLTGPRLGRVRECEGHPCGWLFLDTTRNRSRRWCSMAGCGNRAKARRHYARAGRR